VADGLHELHTFAAMIGVKRHFFHNTPSTPHYDVTAAQRAVAILYGALEITSRELVRIAKNAKTPVTA
jgi:hypothetical protein